LGVSSLRSEERELANVAGKALCFALRECAADPNAPLPPVDVCEEVVLALCTAQSGLLAAGLFSVLAGFLQFKAFVETNLLESAAFVNLFSLSAQQQGDALCMLLVALNGLWKDSSRPLLVNGHPLTGLLISSIRSGSLAVRKEASILVFRLLDEQNTRSFFQEGLVEALQSALTEELPISGSSFRGNSFVPDGSMSLFADCNTFRLLLCLEKIFALMGGVESESLRGLPNPLLQGLFSCLLMLSNTSAHVDLVRMAWKCLIHVVLMLDRKNSAAVSPLFWTHLGSSVVRLLEAGFTDLCGIPFGEICGPQTSESLRLDCVKCLTKVVLTGKPWGKRVVLALGSTFLQCYVSLVNCGMLEPSHFLIDGKDLVLGKQLGTGASGTVYLASFRGQELAVKSIDDNSLSFNLKVFSFFFLNRFCLM